MLGIGAVGGMAVARLHPVTGDVPEIIKTAVGDPEAEFGRFLHARTVAARQLATIREAAEKSLGKENADILDYQLLILEDTDFTAKIKEIIDRERVNCEYALDSVARGYLELVGGMDNEYLKQRTADISDIARRLNFALRGKECSTLSDINEDSIVAAEDLTPSQTASVKKDKVKGIALERGGMSSHSVILARSMDIPCVIGVQGLMKNAVRGETALIDGDSGEITISPGQERIDRYHAFIISREKEKQLLEGYKRCRSLTRDGFEMRVYANISSEGEASQLLMNGAEGVGLFRTEFLFMAGGSPPGEELQYKVYSGVARSLGGRPFIIRTLDAGGDKNIPYLDIPKENNPFLGYRAIRYCLDNPELFKAQISAILRAGAHGSVSYMLPMIASIDEVRRARAIADEAREELSKKEIPFSRNVPMGIMVETPAAAFSADAFAKEADFFSIGTNDLTQYLFAADRMNPKVIGLNSCFHPTLLKTVKHICECAHNSGIEVDICGQAGEVRELVPLWAAMGVDCLSVSIPAVPRVRRAICETAKSEALGIMEKALSMDTANEVESYLKSQFYDREEQL